MKIVRPVLQGMIEHAVQEAPLECCGLLSGFGGVIRKSTRLTNEKQSSTEFFAAPGELLDFFKSLRRSGEEFLGIYHSHPCSEPVPSARDEAEFHYPGVSYWIISLKAGTPTVTCWEWRERRFHPRSFQVLEEGEGNGPQGAIQAALPAACGRLTKDGGAVDNYKKEPE